MLFAILRDERGEVGDITPPASAEPVAVEPQPGETQTPPPGEPNEPQPVEPEPEPDRHVPLKALEDERRKRQELAEQVAYYRGLAEAQKATPAQPQDAGPQAPVEPKLDDYEDFDAFEKAKDRFLIEQAKYELSTEFRQKFEQSNRQRTEQEIAESFMRKIEVAAEQDPEIINFVQNYHLPGPYHIPLSDPMAQVLKESECPAQLLRYLASNKQEATRIARLSSIAAAKELGKLEAKILNTPPPPPPKTVSAAPEPITTVNTSGNASDVSLEDLSMEDFVRRRNAEQYHRR